MISTPGRPTPRRALSRRHQWGVILTLSLVSGLLFLPATSANATSFVVTTDADAGQGSLRQAILDANANPGSDDITFAIPGAGSQIITLLSPLPAIAEQASIDASTQPGASCNTPTPTLLIRLHGSNAGAGTSALTVAGGTGTVIKGFVIRFFSGDGISVSAPASGTTVTCNAIGTTADGTANFGNTGAGVAVRSTDPAATDPTTISGNVIMNNGGPGVLVGADARNVTIRGNRINTNLGVGIDLVPAGGPSNGDGSTPNGPGAGGNDLLFFPELASASPSGGGTTVAGSLTVPTAADGEFVVDFYSVSRCDNAPPPGGFGEGAVPIGSIEMPAASVPTTVPFTADGLGMVSVGSFVTATATDGFGAGNTSEFSACAQVADNGPESADLSISVQNAPNPVTGGYDLGSTATVTNQGPGDATGVTLTDTLANGETFVGGGSDPSCSADAGVVTCPLDDLASGVVATVLIVTKTPHVSADATIHDVFAVSAAEDDTPDNSTLDVSTAVRAPSANFVAGYVPVSSSITWLSDATQWSHGEAVATMADPTVASVGIPGGGPGGPVVITRTLVRRAVRLHAGATCTCDPSHASAGGFGNLVDVNVPSGYGAANPITGVFLDNWSVLGCGLGPVRGLVPAELDRHAERRCPHAEAGRTPALRACPRSAARSSGGTPTRTATFTPSCGSPTVERSGAADRPRQAPPRDLPRDREPHGSRSRS